MHFFACTRVRELQLCRVQALTGVIAHIFAILRELRAAINLVAQEWVPYVRKVDAYLVCSARFEDTFNVRRAREIFHNFNVSDGIFGIFLCYRHFFRSMVLLPMGKSSVMFSSILPMAMAW